MDRHGIAPWHLVERLERGGAAKRGPAGEQLVENRPERVLIAQGAESGYLAAGLLGGHVTGRAHDCAADRALRAAGPSAVFHDFGEPKVGDLRRERREGGGRLRRLAFVPGPAAASRPYAHRPGAARRRT